MASRRARLDAAGELDAFTKSLVLMTMDRWADECEAEDSEHVTFEDDDDDDADERVYAL